MGWIFQVRVTTMPRWKHINSDFREVVVSIHKCGKCKMISNHNKVLFCSLKNNSQFEKNLGLLLIFSVASFLQSSPAGRHLPLSNLKTDQVWFVWPILVKTKQHICTNTFNLSARWRRANDLSLFAATRPESCCFYLTKRTISKVHQHFYNKVAGKMMKNVL